MEMERMVEREQVTPPGSYRGAGQTGAGQDKVARRERGALRGDGAEQKTRPQGKGMGLVGAGMARGAGGPKGNWRTGERKKEGEATGASTGEGEASGRRTEKEGKQRIMRRVPWEVARRRVVSGR